MTSDIYTRRIQEHIEPGLPRLGRHVMHDPRSRDYPAATATKIRSVLHNARGLPLDQTRGSCTAEALCGALNSDPDFRTRVFTQADADALYDQEIVLEGGDPKTDDPGGTGLLICKVAKRAGLIRGYKHAFGITHALLALALRPVMFGVDWYNSFDSPDPKTGLIKLDTSSGIRGGHEIVADEINADAKLVGCWQSWGDWALAGKFYVSFDDLDGLLQSDGDCTVPYV